MPFACAQMLRNLHRNGQAMAFQPHQDDSREQSTASMNPGSQAQILLLHGHKPDLRTDTDSHRTRRTAPRKS